MTSDCCRSFSGMEGRSVPIADTISGCRAILDCACDDCDEETLYMVGDLTEARRKQDDLTRRNSRERPAAAR